VKKRGPGLPKQNPPPLATFSPRKQLPGTTTSPLPCNVPKDTYSDPLSIVLRLWPCHMPQPREATASPVHASLAQPPREGRAALPGGGPCSGSDPASGPPSMPTATCCSTFPLPPALSSAFSERKSFPLPRQCWECPPETRRTWRCGGKVCRASPPAFAAAGRTPALPGNPSRECWLNKNRATSKIKSEQSL